MKTAVYIILGICVIGAVFVGIGFIKSLGHDVLPSDIDIAYKEIQLRGMPPKERYVVIDTSGSGYWVEKDVFESLQVIQKIGENLYRLPDGDVLTSIPAKINYK